MAAVQPFAASWSVRDRSPAPRAILVLWAGCAGSCLLMLQHVVAVGLLGGGSLLDLLVLWLVPWEPVW